AVNASIGQGDVVVTPLQMALAYSAIVNGGKVYKPHVLKGVTDPQTGALVQEVKPELVRTLPIKTDYLNFVTEAMKGGVRGGGPGCRATSDGAGVPVPPRGGGAASPCRHHAVGVELPLDGARRRARVLRHQSEAGRPGIPAGLLPQARRLVSAGRHGRHGDRG